MARATHTRSGIGGSHTEPVLPTAGKALAEGLVSVEHLQVLVRLHRSLPARVTVEEWEPVEAVLTELATQVGPRELARFAAREVLPRLDPDGKEPADGDAAERPTRRLRLRDHADGSGSGEFELDAEANAQLRAVLSPLAKPRPAADGVPDPRGIEARRGDALAEVIELAAGSADRPGEAGDKPQLVVTVALEDLEQELSQALLGPNLVPMSAAARRLACDADAVPAVLGSDSQPLDIGRETRSIPPAIRRALMLRDRGCAFPECDRPPGWCQAHQLIHWVDGGPTTLGNLALLCGPHHRVVHHGDWDIHIADDGLPELLPAYLDAARTPRRNPLRRRE